MSWPGKQPVGLAWLSPLSLGAPSASMCQASLKTESIKQMHSESRDWWLLTDYSHLTSHIEWSICVLLKWLACLLIEILLTLFARKLISTSTLAWNWLVEPKLPIKLITTIWILSNNGSSWKLIAASSTINVRFIANYNERASCSQADIATHCFGLALVICTSLQFDEMLFSQPNRLRYRCHCICILFFFTRIW